VFAPLLDLAPARCVDIKGQRCAGTHEKGEDDDIAAT
jgi:hypothetical protein